MENNLSLNNKVAVVTGGSRGIGRAICEAFCKNGADVAFLDAGSMEVAEETVRIAEGFASPATLAAAVAMREIFMAF